MSKRALVIGATGLLGYGVSTELAKDGWHVKGIGRKSVDKGFFVPEIKYLQGDFYNEDFLRDSLKDIDIVFFFMSTTFPSTSSNSIELEKEKTVGGLEYLIKIMLDCKVTKLVYPSSGGTIYGKTDGKPVKETNDPNPITPYGKGKLMAENLIKEYSSHGLDSVILRISNVYGSKVIRDRNQGVIDIFIQKALNKEPLTIWSGAKNQVRDYIYIDDFSNAVKIIANRDFKGFNVYNLGSGIGTSLNQILKVIENKLNDKLIEQRVESSYTADLDKITLDISKIKKDYDWIPRINIESGISKLIEGKNKQ